MSIKRLVISIIGLLIISGHAFAPGYSASDSAMRKHFAQNSRTAQLIIKFRDPHLDASRPDVADDLSTTAGTKLVYVRAISGGSYVFYPENVSGNAAMAKIIMRLSTRPDIMYVEEDKIMRHHLDR